MQDLLENPWLCSVIGGVSVIKGAQAAYLKRLPHMSTKLLCQLLASFWQTPKLPCRSHQTHGGNPLCQFHFPFRYSKVAPVWFSSVAAHAQDGSSDSGFWFRGFLLEVVLCLLREGHGSGSGFLLDGSSVRIYGSGSVPAPPNKMQPSAIAKA